MKSNNMFDRVRRRDIGFLPDLNTEHVYHCNSLLYLGFVIGEKRKKKRKTDNRYVFANEGSNTNSTIDS
jgi:hypothetical protein